MVSILPPAQATSATDGCRDASTLVADGSTCPLALEMKKWLDGGHAQRSFSRHPTNFCSLRFKVWDTLYFEMHLVDVGLP